MKVIQIGLGGWGKNHTKLLSEMGVLVGVCDIDTYKAIEFGEKYNVIADDVLDDLINETKPDIAIVTTPTNTHHSITMKLLENNINVFVEKPFTSTEEQGWDIIEKAMEKGLLVTCGYIERFNPVTQFIKEQKEQLLLLEFHRESKFPHHINDVGIVLDTVVHDIDTACYLFGGYPVKVQCVIKRIQAGDSEDLAIIILSFQNGIANIVANWNTSIKKRTIQATYKDMIIEGDFVTKIAHKRIGNDYTGHEFTVSNPLKDELRYFIDSVKNGTEPIVTPIHANRITTIAKTILDEDEKFAIVFCNKCKGKTGISQGERFCKGCAKLVHACSCKVIIN